ncbi:hypothetical protein [Gardnerella vaginalis]|uniref:Uncharacterized protein n=1 Tax=Gardnerella vaginalis TaxID=2702 RepID=A0A2K1SU53_GARVA|nr:hypothetical protein [Gardnerella vaginalis]PNS43077.1 hypothetical protein BFS05_04875 [Gardnerella vaginalis]
MILKELQLLFRNLFALDKHAIDKIAFNKLSFNKHALDKTMLDKSTLDKSTFDMRLLNRRLLNRRLLNINLRDFYKFFIVLIVSFMVISLGACEPEGKAVGDSGSINDIVHDGVDLNDINIFVLGSSRFSLDNYILDECKKYGMKASYVALFGIKNSSSSAYDALKEATYRQMSLIIIDEIDVDSQDSVDSSESAKSAGSKTEEADKKTTEKSFEEALQDVRRAGIPVLLVNPIKAPEDSTLYAAKAYSKTYLDKKSILKTKSAKYESLQNIVKALINDTPHSREVIIDGR